MSNTRTYTVAFLLILGLAAGQMAFYYGGATGIELAQRLPDDAYYFMKTSDNIYQGAGLTFDGINPTNGFQPLWLLLLVPVQALQLSPEAMVRVVLAYQMIFLFLAGWWLFSVVHTVFSERAALVAALFYAFMILVQSSNGMDSAILVFMLSATLYAGWKWKLLTETRLLPNFLFGLLLGLIMLARLDHVFLLLAIYGVLALAWLKGSGERKALFGRLLMLGLGSAVIMLPYLIYNQVNFGSIMPISGQLKSSFPQIALSDHALSRISKGKYLQALLAAAYVAWYLVRGRAAARGNETLQYWRLAASLLSVTVVAHFLHTILYMNWGVFAWHFIAYNYLLVMLAAEGAEVLIRRLSGAVTARAYWPALAIAVVVGLAWSAHAKRGAVIECNSSSYEAAVWAREHSDPTDIFCQRDTGTFGYYSGRRTINLDGLVNNEEFQESLRNRELRQYLTDKGADYLIYHSYGRYAELDGDYRDFGIRYMSRKYGNESDELRFSHTDEVFRSQVYYDNSPDRPYVLVIWDLRSALAGGVKEAVAAHAGFAAEPEVGR